MFQAEDRIVQLVSTYLTGDITPSQQSELEEWLAESDENRSWFERFCSERGIRNSLTRFREVNSEKIWAITSQKAGLINPDTETKVREFKLWKKIAVAAAVATMVIGAAWFFFTPINTKQNTDTYASTILAGKQGATLTLANGTQIRLGDAKSGELAKQSGVIITKTNDGQLVYEIESQKAGGDQINTLSTSNGETYRLKLPDGSMVWLNSASSLTYRASLNENGKRMVRLTGEGYFEVAKDKAHPFVVQTSNQQVEVLGTQFNLNSYPNENATVTTLVEGSVKVFQADQTAVLKPGEQSNADGDKILVGQANIESITDWKNGDFYLERINLKLAMRKIARWYNVEVVYDSSVPDNIQSGGWISRERDLGTVLRGIEKAGLVKFRVENKTIYVSK